MANQIQNQSLKLGTHTGLGHVLLFVTSGEAGVNGEPFAVVYATSYEPPIKGPRFWEDEEVGTPVIFGARIGKIQSGVLPDQFYNALFKDMDEAVDEVRRFFSLTETQKILAVHGDVPYKTPFQRIAKELAIYTLAVEALKNDLVTPPETFSKRMIEHTETLINEMSLAVSPFSVTCSANTGFMQNGVQIAIMEYILMLCRALTAFRTKDNAQSVTSATSPPNSEDLNFAVTCLADFIKRNLDLENSALERSRFIMSRPIQVG